MSRSLKSLAVLVFEALLLALVYSQPAQACEAASNARPDSTCVVMLFSGRQGVWFDLPTAEGLRKMTVVFPELQLQIKKYEEVDVIRQDQLKQLREILDLRVQTNQRLHDALENSTKALVAAREDAKEAREEMGMWYRTPVLWAVLGAAAGIVTVVVAR